VFPLVVVAFVYFKKPIWLSGESDGHVSRRQALEAKTTSNVSLFSVFLACFSSSVWLFSIDGSELAK